MPYSKDFEQALIVHRSLRALEMGSMESTPCLWISASPRRIRGSFRWSLPFLLGYPKVIAHSAGVKIVGYSRLERMAHEDLILGIDPGTIQTGYALLSAHPKLTVVDYGCVTPPKRMELTRRYRVLFEATQALIRSHRPAVMVIETQFVKDNVQSAMKLGMARGVIILAATLEEIPVFEYAPARVKVAIVGHGRASKHQIQEMLKRLLSLSHIPEPADAADALAIALCHAFTQSRRERCMII